ncbi:tetratricopeptide repeat protein, partial [Legionella drancourtii]|uniref:tetratricopeptide repeat protein n=1 Tax=Legionella drancourtii TaxID=168933 RepID=UPI00058D0980
LSFLAQDENNLTLLVKISDLYLELDDLDSAQEYLNKASALDRIACLGHQGLLHLNQGQFAQAKEYFIEALNHEETPALRYNLGFTHFIASDLENAAQVLSPLIKGEHHPEAKLLMARILHGQGDLEQARDLINDVLAHDADDSEALGLLALVYFDLDEIERAAQASARALALNPDNYDAQLIDALSRLTTQETSVEELEKLLQLNPDDCRLWFALGNVHMSQGALDLAEHSLRKAIEIYPEFYDAYIALGWCLLLLDNVDDALIIYQAAAGIVPELADSWGGLALVAALNEDFLNAERLIQKSKDLNSDCFLAEIAESIYFNHKNPLKAKEHLVNALKNTKVPASEKLAFIIEDMQGTTQFH